MHTVHLRQVGGSTMLAIPPVLLKALNFGDTVALSTENGKLLVEKPKPSYTLEQLLLECDQNAPVDAETQQWLNTPPVGC